MSRRPDEHIELQRLLYKAHLGGSNRRYQDCSWDDVLSSLDEALEAYDSKSANSKARKMVRSRTILTNLESLAQLIPEENGLSILRGGLTMVLKLIKKRTESADRILRSLREIPFLLERACGALISASHDNMLRCRVQDLCFTLLREIPTLIEVLLRKHQDAFHIRLLKQHPDAEASIVDACLESITTATGAVESRIQIVHTVIIKETQEGIAANSRDLDWMRIELVNTHQDVIDGNKEHITQFQVILDSMESTILGRTASMEARWDERLETLQSQYKDAILDALQHAWPPLVREMSSMLCNAAESKHTPPSLDNIAANLDVETETTRIETILCPGSLDILTDTQTHYAGSKVAELTDDQNDQHSKTNVSLQKETLSTPGAKQRVTEALAAAFDKEGSNLSFSRIIKLLEGPDPAWPFSDLENVLRQGSNLNARALDQAKWLTKMERFGAWLAEGEGTQSDVLLVDGHSEEMSGKVSALSVMCGTMTTKMIAEGLPVLYHFCGEHTSYGDPMAGPRGMLRNLVFQLIIYTNQLPERLWIGDGSFHEEFEEQTLYAFAALLQHLLSQIFTKHVVFIVLDGVSEFESDLHGWREELIQVVTFLYHLGCDATSGIRLKILMTCPIKSTSLVSCISAQDHISLMAGNM